MGKVKLQKLCGILSGYAFDSQQFTEKSNDMPLIRIRDVVRGHTKTYTKEKYDEKYVIKKDDLLIGMDGEFNIATWKSDDALLNQRVCKIYSTSDMLFEKYLFYFLPAALKAIEASASFVTVKHLSVKQINEIEIPLPPLEVQRKIAETLNAASELLAMRKNQLAELDKLIQSVFYDMFGDPVANEKGWEITPLENILSFIRNGASIKQGDKSGGYPITRIETISDATVDRSRFGYAGIFDIKHYESYILQDDDILMSHINSIKHLGKSALYKRQNNEIIIHGMNLLCLRPKHNHVEGIYLNYYFKTDDFKIKILGITKPAVNQASFTTKALKDLVIPLPPLESQIEFAETVQKIEEQKALVQKAIDETQALFDSLMNEYFE